MTERKDFKVELEHHKIMSRASQLNDSAFSYKMKPTIETAYETYYKPNLRIKYTSHHKVVPTQWNEDDIYKSIAIRQYIDIGSHFEKVPHKPSSGHAIGVVVPIHWPERA